MRPTLVRMISDVLFVPLLLAPPARSADYYWNPATVSGNWTSNPNWGTAAAGPYTQNWADSNTANFSAANQSITVNSFVTLAGLNFTASGVTVAAGSGDLRLVGSVPVSVSGANTATVSEDMISIGAGSVLVKQGTGTLVLSGTNSITTVTISSGTLRLGSNSALGSASLSPALVVDGTLDLAGFSGTRGALSGTGTVTSSVVGSVATLTVGTGFAGTTTFSGVVQNGTGTVALTKVGTGTLVLNSANTYSGVTTLSDGTLRTSLLANAGTASGIGTGTGGGVVLGGGTLEYTGTGASSNRTFTLSAGTSTINNTGTGPLSLTNTGIGINGAGVVTLVLSATNSGGNNTFAAPLTQNAGGTTNLSKTGAGTWVLTSSSLSYNGTTTVSAGGLYVNGTKSGAGAVSVNAGGTLGGTGSIAGATTLTSATLEIGNGTAANIGALTLGDVSATASTARFHFDRAGGNAAGAGYDRLNVTGTIDLTGLTLDAVVNGNGGATVFTTMTIIDAAAGSLSGTFAGLPDGAQIMTLNNFAGAEAWAVRYVYASGDVQLVPVPEPASVVGVAAAGLGLTLGVRRRLRSSRRHFSGTLSPFTLL